MFWGRGRGLGLGGGQLPNFATRSQQFIHAQVYLLDDPLAAVDAATAAHLLRACVCAPGDSVLSIGRSTRLLVSSSRGGWLLNVADSVVLMNAGRVAFHGSPSGLVAAVAGAPGRALGGAADAGGIDEEDEDGGDIDGPPPPPPFTQPQPPPPPLSLPSPHATPDGSLSPLPSPPPSPPASVVALLRRSLDEGERSIRKRRDAEAASAAAAAAATSSPASAAPAAAATHTLVQAEKSQEGTVTWATYATYCSAAGGSSAVASVCLSFFLQALASVATTLWLAFWVRGRHALCPLLPPFFFLSALISPCLSHPALLSFCCLSR